MSEEDWSENRGKESFWYHVAGFFFFGLMAVGLVKLGELIQYVF